MIKIAILFSLLGAMLMIGCFPTRFDPRQQVYNFRECIDPVSIKEESQFNRDADECCEIAYGRYRRLRNTSIAVEFFDPFTWAVVSEATPIGSRMVNALGVFKKCMALKGYGFYENSIDERVKGGAE